MDALVGRRHSTAASGIASASDLAEEDRRLAAEDRRQAARYLSAAYRDETTGALNRRPGREQMQALLELLAAVGTALRSSLRSYDLVVRYGGDEFVCALPGGTAEVARDSLARVRSAIDRLISGATISAGCADHRASDTLDDVIRRADTDLYQERRLGRRSVRLTLTQPRDQQRPSVGCGACGGRVALSDFVLELTVRMTRKADCPDCGATTMIQLAPASVGLRPGERITRSDGG